MTRARLGALTVAALAIVASSVFGGVDAAAQVPTREALIVLVDDATMEELLTSAPFAGLAGEGGAGLLSGSGVSLRDAVEALRFDEDPRSGIVPEPIDGLGIFNDGSIEGSDGTASRRAIDVLADGLQRDLAERGLGRPELMLLIASASPASASEDAGDELGALILAIGTPDVLASAMAGAETEPGSLTSASTRRDGVVVTADITRTVTGYLDQPPPGGDLGGEPIEVIEGPPPFGLHERYLAQRRMYIPIGAAAAVYVIGFGLVAVAFLAAGPRIGARWRRVFGWISLSVPMLAVGLLAAGHLPELTYATVVPFIALVTVFGTLAFAPLERRDVLLVPAGIGLAVLGFLVVEAALGWSAMLTPFVGGSQLDGGRFYGMPNVCIGLLVGACFWVAQRLRTVAGVWLLVGAALFAGLPFLGANLGGAATLFAGAGLWLALRERERLGTWKGLAVFLGFTLVGTALILLVHAISPIETHVTRFEEQVSGLGGVLREFTDRLQVGFDLIARNPLALIPTLGLPVAILAVLRPPSALRPSLERSPAWRDAILATLLTGVVAYVLNDSGPAAAGFAFGVGLGGLMGVPLLLGAGKMVNR